jgi:hypothetical protein
MVMSTCFEEGMPFLLSLAGWVAILEEPPSTAAATTGGLLRSGLASSYQELVESPVNSPANTPALSWISRSTRLPTTMPRGLREMTRARILEIFKSLEIHEPGGVLVCDKLALRVVSSACRVSEIMEEGITLVEALEIERQPLREFAAIYLITPTVDSVNAMLSDYRDPRNPRYGEVHVLFTSHLPDALLGKIKASGLVSRIKTFRELSFEYLAIESGAFTLDAPDAMSSIFSPASTKAVPEQHRIASQLATLFGMYGEMPYVRFGAKGHPSSSSLAYIVQEKLERLGAASGCFKGRPRGERPTLLIIDRTLDPLAPLLHEYSYQAMVHDLLPIVDGERYAYHFTTNRGETQKRDVLLNETDPLWPTLRHMHIADCIEYLTSNFNQFLSANQSATKLGKQGGSVGLKEMSDALRGMPQYQDEMGRYSLHISLTRELMARFKQHQLEAISTLEQNMALGEDSDGAAAPRSQATHRLPCGGSCALSPSLSLSLWMCFPLCVSLSPCVCECASGACLSLPLSRALPLSLPPCVCACRVSLCLSLGDMARPLASFPPPYLCRCAPPVRAHRRLRWRMLPTAHTRPLRHSANLKLSPGARPSLPRACPSPPRLPSPPPRLLSSPPPVAARRRRPSRRQGGGRVQARRRAARDGEPRHLSAGQDAAADDLHHLAGGHPRRRPPPPDGRRGALAGGAGRHRESLLHGRDALPRRRQGLVHAPQAAEQAQGCGRRELRSVAIHANAQARRRGRAHQRRATRRLPVRQGQADGGRGGCLGGG